MTLVPYLALHQPNGTFTLIDHLRCSLSMTKEANQARLHLLSFDDVHAACVVMNHLAFLDA